MVPSERRRGLTVHHFVPRRVLLPTCDPDSGSGIVGVSMALGVCAVLVLPEGT